MLRDKKKKLCYTKKDIHVDLKYFVLHRKEIYVEKNSLLKVLCRVSRGTKIKITFRNLQSLTTDVFKTVK